MKGVRRIYIPGALYFFTVVTYKRIPILNTDESIDRLRCAFKYCKDKYPFNMRSIVILPDHLHCILQLPENDSNISIRWSCIKWYFSIGIKSFSNNRCEKEIWQPRFIDHIIRNQMDLHNHLDYIYFNPVKHGYVNKPIDWGLSSFKQEIKNGLYDYDWGVVIPGSIYNLDYE